MWIKSMKLKEINGEIWQTIGFRFIMLLDMYDPIQVKFGSGKWIYIYNIIKWK